MDSYTAESIQVLDGIEHVKKRPSMYIGSTGSVGLHHLVYEVIDNAIDEVLAGYCKNISVIIKHGNVIEIIDDGRGIPTDTHPVEKEYVARSYPKGRQRNKYLEIFDKYYRKIVFTNYVMPGDLPFKETDNSYAGLPQKSRINILVTRGVI